MSDLIAEAITEAFGERCPAFDAECDRLRRGWGPSTPTERMARRTDLRAAMTLIERAMDAVLPDEKEDDDLTLDHFQTAYDKLSEGHREIIALLQAIPDLSASDLPSPSGVNAEVVADQEETVERNPKSWAAWKRRAEALEAEVAALQAQAAASGAGEWRSMDSAPKNGMLVLLHRDGERFAAAWMREGAHGPGWCTPDGYQIFRATEWYRLPTSPTLTEPTEGR